MTQFSGSVPVCLGLPLFWPCILFSHCMAFFAFAVAPFVHAICISWPHGSHVCASCSCCSRRNVLICFPIRIARFFLLLCHRLRLIVCCCCCHLFSLAVSLSLFPPSCGFCIHDTTHALKYAMASACHLIFVAWLT